MAGQLSAANKWPATVARSGHDATGVKIASWEARFNLNEKGKQRDGLTETFYRVPGENRTILQSVTGADGGSRLSPGDGVERLKRFTLVRGHSP